MAYNERDYLILRMVIGRNCLKLRFGITFAPAIINNEKKGGGGYKKINDKKEGDGFFFFRWGVEKRLKKGWRGGERVRFPIF